MKVSDLLVKALENEGIRFIFGIPGEENLDFLESLKSSNIQLIMTRHEQAAGFMAATYGRLTHTTGVCLSTPGPGATNLVTAVAYAQIGGMPLLVITGQKPCLPVPGTMRFHCCPSGLWRMCKRQCQKMASLPLTTASTRYGLQEIIGHPCPTPCCWTIPWQPWGPGSLLPSLPDWCIRTKK